MARSGALVVATAVLAVTVCGCSDSTGPGDAGGPDIEDFFTMGPGSTYEYSIDWSEDRSTIETSGTLTMSCLGYAQHAGHEALQVLEHYELEHDDGDSTWVEERSDTTYYRISGGQLLAYLWSSQDARVMLQEPLVAGATWTDGGTIVEIASTDVTVNVPAGSFAGCLAVGESGEPPAMYWSRDVGFWVLWYAGGDDWEHVTELSFH